MWWSRLWWYSVSCENSSDQYCVRDIIIDVILLLVLLVLMTLEVLFWWHWPLLWPVCVTFDLFAPHCRCYCARNAANVVALLFVPHSLPTPHTHPLPHPTFTTITRPSEDTFTLPLLLDLFIVVVYRLRCRLETLLQLYNVFCPRARCYPILCRWRYRTALRPSLPLHCCVIHLRCILFTLLRVTPPIPLPHVVPRSRSRDILQ